MDDSEARSERRIGTGVFLGVVIGIAVGAAVGAIIGAVVWQRLGPILASALFGAIGLGMLGAFVGGMANLESPEPGMEPSEREHPLEEPELTSEERPLRRVDGPGEPPR